MRVLVTAGPTREFIDEVRFISNPSSGKMGFACAAAAARAGHDVTLVAGPVPLPDPKGVRSVRVVSADDMYRAVMKAYPKIDAVIATAAVGDYRPASRVEGKLKKGDGPLLLELVRTKDILLELGRKKGKRTLIGFALEVQNAEREALAKYEKKHLDYIVLNSPSSFGAERMDCKVYRGGKVVQTFEGAYKAAVANWIVSRLGI